MHIHPIWWWIIGGAVTAACWFLYQLAISDFDPFDQDKADWIEYQKQRDWERMSEQNKNPQSK